MPFRADPFAALAGWAEDDHAVALSALGPAGAAGPSDARSWIEAAFEPLPPDPAPGLVTGYFEPLLEGSRHPGPGHPVPLYRPPADLRADKPHVSRAEIAAGALDGRGLELVWLADPVAAYFLHVQGSGRIRLAEGGTLRVGFAGRNHHPYRSLGRALVAEGVFAEGTVTAERLADWLRADPAARLPRLLDNPSFVFFRELDLPAEAGPPGTLGLPLTAGRSLAVDPTHVPLGSLVWLETEADSGPFRRLMVAQDTGGAIRGPNRADIFFGHGDAAWRAASRQNAPGRLHVLRPRDARCRDARCRDGRA